MSLTLGGTNPAVTFPDGTVQNTSANLTAPYTANGVVYASSTSALTTGSALTWNGSQLGINTSNYGTSGGPVIIYGASSNQGIAFQTGSVGGGFISNNGSGAGLNFYTNTGALGSETFTERMRLNSSGYLGIGTNSPTSLLSIYTNSSTTSGQYNSPATLTLWNPNPAANIGGTISFGGAAPSTTSTAFFASIYSGVVSSDSTGTNGYLAFATKTNQTDTSVTERMRITSAGNVGIGNTAGAITYNSTTYNAYLSVGGGSGSTGGLYINAGGGTNQPFMNVVYNSGAIQIMVLDDNGNLIVGTTPARLSSVSNSIYTSGNLLVGTTTANGRITSQSANAANTSYSVYLQDSNAALLFSVRGDGLITTASTGSLGPYNNTTASAANMYVNSSGQLGRSTSALKYKQDVRDLEEINVDQIRAVRYKSKCEGDDQTKDHFGVIADEVDAAGVKELVTYGKTGEVEGFQYERLTVVLLKEIQSLRARLKAANIA
jgi:hypothetical protein